eukprot:354069-Chlamydomonas_euryale.AAC.6
MPPSLPGPAMVADGSGDALHPRRVARRSRAPCRRSEARIVRPVARPSPEARPDARPPRTVGTPPAARYGHRLCVSLPTLGLTYFQPRTSLQDVHRMSATVWRPVISRRCSLDPRATFTLRPRGHTRACNADAGFRRGGAEAMVRRGAGADGSAPLSPTLAPVHFNVALRTCRKPRMHAGRVGAAVAALKVLRGSGWRAREQAGAVRRARRGGPCQAHDVEKTLIAHPRGTGSLASTAPPAAAQLAALLALE